ncbi:MAG: SDR family NAD(P)-dependent oxidoreductase, partial [Akkermansiaceae bacterium]
MYRCALVTGASSGLGEEYARQIAPLCDTIVLVARRGELLETLASELQLDQ